MRSQNISLSDVKKSLDYSTDISPSQEVTANENDSTIPEVSPKKNNLPNKKESTVPEDSTKIEILPAPEVSQVLRPKKYSSEPVSAQVSVKQILLSDICRLDNEKFLNDVIIDFYMKWILRKEPKLD